MAVACKIRSSNISRILVSSQQVEADTHIRLNIIVAVEGMKQRAANQQVRIRWDRQLVYLQQPETTLDALMNRRGPARRGPAKRRRGPRNGEEEEAGRDGGEDEVEVEDTRLAGSSAQAEADWRCRAVAWRSEAE